MGLLLSPVNRKSITKVYKFVCYGMYSTLLLDSRSGRTSPHRFTSHKNTVGNRYVLRTLIHSTYARLTQNSIHCINSTRYWYLVLNRTGSWKRSIVRTYVRMYLSDQIPAMLPSAINLKYLHMRQTLPTILFSTTTKETQQAQRFLRESNQGTN